MSRFQHEGRYLVIGLGRSGLAAVEVLRDQGATVLATDEQDPFALANVIADLDEKDVRFIAPNRLGDVMFQIDAAVLSPGVPRSGSLVRKLATAGIPVISEIEVAYQLCPAKIVAISGTKGKSTTTALAGHLLRTAQRRVLVGGNIGNALIKEAAIARPEDWVIAEVSSFQLESIRDFHPAVSLLLNLAADHLDRYASMEDYVEAKYRIFKNQTADDIFIGNLDDPRLIKLHPASGASRVPAKQMWFSLHTRRALASVFFRDARIWYAQTPGGGAVEVMRRAEVPLVGDHNLQNVLAATCIGIATGLSLEEVRRGIRSFKGMPHRLQTVAEVNGVRFVDDSKATNPAAVIAAVRAFDRPVVLIAGGKSKRTDFREMGQVISSAAKAVVLIGEASGEIAQAVRGPDVRRARSMEEAVRIAASLARSGDVVLLSPGCASFDMFDSAEHRGDVFARAVRELPEAARA